MMSLTSLEHGEAPVRYCWTRSTCTHGLPTLLCNIVLTYTFFACML